VTINPLACPLWSAEHESNLAKTYDSYTTRRDAICAPPALRQATKKSM